MEQSGASAVIVGDNRQQSDLISMYADGPADDISIPSTFVDSASFGYLFKMADWQAYTNNPTDGMVQILPNAINYESLTRSFFSLLPSLLFLCIVFYSVVNGIMARRRRNRYLLNGGLLSSSREGSFGEFGRRGGRRFSGDTISVVQVNHNLKNLSSKQFVIKEIKENDALCCAICLDDFEDGQSLVVLSCNHHYHPDCIKAWLIKMTPHLCPICKKEVLCSCGGGSSDGEEGEEEDGEDAVFDADQLAHLGVAALTTSHNSGSRSGRSTTADELLSSSSLSSSTAASPTASENGGGDEDSDPLVIRRRPGNDNNNNNTVESSSSSSSSNSTPTVMNWTSWQAIRRSWNALSGGGDVGGGTSDTQV